MAYLELQTGHQPVEQINLGNTLSVGRSTDNDVILSDGRVSRNHARITRDGDDFFLEDLSSSNGTFLRDQRLTPGTQSELVEGDEIRLGSTRFVFRLYRFISSSSEIPRPAGWAANPPRPDVSPQPVRHDACGSEKKKSSLAELLNTPVPMPGFLRSKERPAAKLSV